MSVSDGKYFLIFPDYEHEENVSLKPDKKTAKSGYGTRELAPGRPLFFTNAYPEYIPEGESERITDIMFGCNSFVVNKNIKEFVSQFSTFGLQLYPAVYADLNGKYHEDYWFLNFFAYIDCWDRKLSEYTPGVDEDDSPSITRFHLDDEVLARIPEENRYLFSIGGLSEDFIFVHEKVADFFTQNKTTGIRLFPASEFVYGMQNYPSG